MKLVLDTNVLLSGIFFSGAPHEILRAWSAGGIRLVASPEILREYSAAGDRLSERFTQVDIGAWLALVVATATVVDAPALPEPVCTDPDDDKFLACAVAARCRTVVSGDRALLRTHGYRGISVLTPRQFVD